MSLLIAEAAARPRRMKDDADAQKDSGHLENLFDAAERLLWANPEKEMTMGYNLIRYGVKDESITENRTLVAKVFEALDETKPLSVRYLVLELENGEFVHLVGYNKDSAALTGLDAFKAFSADHAERRSGPLARSAAKIVGNYRMLDNAVEALPA
ncbi:MULTISPECIES: hypothetical protein [unclassified Mesorhizobium]|nr:MULTISPECIES: hypothetical protein [unclassified Mesorhizobium]